eukprot:gene8824-58671_t
MQIDDKSDTSYPYKANKPPWVKAPDGSVRRDRDTRPPAALAAGPQGEGRPAAAACAPAA